jgi:hypothetical protein
MCNWEALMDYFEAIVTTLLEHEGYWVRQSFKVNLTKDEKKAIGKPSIPRPEIDIIAFKPKGMQVLALEAKSYLDSPGVRISDLMHEYNKPEGRYKLFTCTIYRKTVLRRLRIDLEKAGMIQSKTMIKLGLIAGKVYQRKSDLIRAHLDSKDWFFWSPEDMKSKLKAMADEGYENDPSIITAKILER